MSAPKLRAPLNSHYPFPRVSPPSHLAQPLSPPLISLPSSQRREPSRPAPLPTVSPKRGEREKHTGLDEATNYLDPNNKSLPSLRFVFLLRRSLLQPRRRGGRPCFHLPPPPRRLEEWRNWHLSITPLPPSSLPSLIIFVIPCSPFVFVATCTIQSAPAAISLKSRDFEASIDPCLECPPWAMVRG